MNRSEFQQKVTAAEKPVIVDFWAPWCVPCRVTKPILEKLAADYNGQVDFMPVNADDSREVLAQFQVIGIPTVLALRHGQVVGRVTGAQNKSSYRLMFESLAEGGEVKFSLSSFDRILRLGSGGMLMLVGISTGSWLVVGIGALIFFLGVYDRCPVWRAISGILFPIAHKK